MCPGSSSRNKVLLFLHHKTFRVNSSDGENKTKGMWFARNEQARNNIMSKNHK